MTFENVYQEFVSWQPFTKFVDRVGLLKRPHLPGTGMWWVEFSGVYVEREREREREGESKRKKEKKLLRMSFWVYAVVCCGVLRCAATKSTKDSKKKHQRSQEKGWTVGGKSMKESKQKGERVETRG